MFNPEIYLGSSPLGVPQDVQHQPVQHIGVIHVGVFLPNPGEVVPLSIYLYQGPYGLFALIQSHKI